MGIGTRTGLFLRSAIRVGLVGEHCESRIIDTIFLFAVIEVSAVLFFPILTSAVSH